MVLRGTDVVFIHPDAMSDHSGTQRLGPGTGMLATDAGGALVVRRVLVRVVSGPDRGHEPPSSTRVS